MQPGVDTADLEAGGLEERRPRGRPGLRMVVANDPAPPGDVEQGRPRSGVLEVEERADLAVHAHDDVDRREIAVDERDLLQLVPRLPNLRHSVGRVAALDIDLEVPDPAGETTHPRSEVACPVGIAEPVCPGLTPDPRGDQPRGAGHLDDGRPEDGQAGSGDPGHEPADPIDTGA